MRRIVLYFFLLGIISAFVKNAMAEPYPSKITVLSSIKPIQSIVLAITAKRIKSEQLIPDYASPHDYAFKPSDLRKIKRADIIFRIDAQFEGMLNPVFKNVADQSKVISLAKNPKIHLLPVVAGHTHSHTNNKDNHKIAKNYDMHIFTSPKNVLLMAQMITETLGRVDPKNQEIYKANLQNFKEVVANKVKEIRKDFQMVNITPYFVFHNSWQYFGEYFGLQKPEIISLHEGISTGVKTILNIRKEIVADKVGCVFSDPSISTVRINALLESLSVRTEEIDILQSDISLDESTYVNWLESMRVNIKSCLSGKE